MHVTVRAPDNVVLARAQQADWPTSALTMRRHLGDRADNSLDGFIADVAIDPAAADRLVIGGLPSSRISLLLVLLLLSLGLTGVAVVQIARAQALARLRQEFVTRTSHELRTPVAQIRMFTDTLLLDRVRTDDERRRSLEAIDRGARRLAHLVDNVMQFARRESQSNGRSREPADLAVLAREAIDEFEAMLVDGPRIALDSVPDARAAVDPEAFRQILVNLLDNAVKYGGDDRAADGHGNASAGACVRVQVATIEAGQGVEVSVEDGGPGIPVADRERVWQPYFRLDRDRASAVAGAGIGLAVVRDLVSQQHGRARVEEAPGGGARIAITFPAAAAQEARPS